MSNIFERLLSRNRDAPEIHTGKISGQGTYNQTLSPYRSRTDNLLTELRLYQDQGDAIEFCSKNIPDVAKALWNMIRLLNLGSKMEFYGTGSKKASPIREFEDEWREFASRVNYISASGLDGLIDIFHRSAILRGGQGCEVVVMDDMSDIDDVYPIKPQSINWKQEDRGKKNIWVPYQSSGVKQVDLSQGNFFYVPTDPDIDDPRGNLMLSPALQSVDYQLQSYMDMAAVLRRQGYPRNDVELDREALVKNAPAQVKNNPQSLKKYLEDYYEWVKKLLRGLEPTDDFIHYNDTKINTSQGSNPSRSMDIRAFSEMTDIQVMNGLMQLSVFSNRNTGVTESWGTVQFQIFCSGLASLQRGSKRLIESIARLWLQVKGYQATPKFSYTVMDWNSEEQRMNVKLMEQKLYGVAQLMGWVDGDIAASKVMGVDKAVGVPVEGTKATFGIGGSDGDVGSQRQNGNKQSKEPCEDMQL
jgi:hypothetical protein